MKIYTEGLDFISRIKVLVAYKLSRSNLKIAQSLANLGMIADYTMFVRKSFGMELYKSAFTPKRETSWEQIVKKINKVERVLFLEFGVAEGYATFEMFSIFKQYGFQNKEKTQPGFFYHIGFDLFSGLPKSFRQYPTGYFATHDKNPPNIAGANYVKGLVQETLLPELRKIDLKNFDRVVIFFDLDLYEPTKYVIDALGSFLRSSTLIYFDELFDSQERKVLLERFGNLNELELVSYTPTSGTFLIK